MVFIHGGYWVIGDKRDVLPDQFDFESQVPAVVAFLADTIGPPGPAISHT